MAEHGRFGPSQIHVSQDLVLHGGAIMLQLGHTLKGHTKSQGDRNLGIGDDVSKHLNAYNNEQKFPFLICRCAFLSRVTHGCF